MQITDLSIAQIPEWNLIKPPWTVWGRRSSEEERLDWFLNARPVLEKISEERIEEATNNLLWYTGEYDKTLEYRMVLPNQTGEQRIPRKLLPRIFNQLFELTEQNVSRLCRYRADFEVVPTNREEKDRVVARLLDLALQAMARRERIDFLMPEIERWKTVFGELLVWVEWDKNIGDRKGFRSLERVGDVQIKLFEPWRFFPEPRHSRHDVTWMIVIKDIIHIEEARKKFKMTSLEPDDKTHILSFNSDVYEKRHDDVVVYELWQKPTEFLPEGAVTTFCADRIVDEVETYPYSHLELPGEWYTDLDIPGKMFPKSIYSQIKPVQHCYNRLTSLMVRNQLLTQHPHVLLPEGSAKIEAFTNQPSVIRYSPIAGAKPEVVTFSGLNQETLQLWNEFEKVMEKLFGVQGVSRGAPPPGTRSNSMLRFYEEQEEQRATTAISKHNELIRQMYKKAASIMCDYYPTSSADRLIRVVGKENEYLIDSFVGTKPSSEYDVIIINSTGFSRSMAGRLEEIERLQQVAPGLLSPQQMMDVLELKNPQKAYDIMTASLKFAEMINELILSGKDLPEPREYWDLIVHWQQTMIMMNSPQWAKVPPQVQQAAEDHVLALEMLMADKAAVNPAFAQKLGMLELYPAFFVPEPALEAEATKPAEPQAPAPMPMDPGMMPPPGAPMPPMAGPAAGLPPLPPQEFPGEVIGAELPPNPINPLLGAL